MPSNFSYNSVEIGDYAWLVPSVSFPDTARFIPRAQGIRQRDMGGGEMTLTVKSWVVKTTITSLAQYLESLGRNFGTGLASLVGDSITYANCKCVSITPEDRHADRMDFFVCVFKKSQATQ
mgnify:CR=1 FL=1